MSPDARSAGGGGGSTGVAGRGTGNTLLREGDEQTGALENTRVLVEGIGRDAGEALGDRGRTLLAWQVAFLTNLVD